MLANFAILLAFAPVGAALLQLVATAVIGVPIEQPLLMWPLLTASIAAVGIGALSVFAVFGSPGALINTFFFVALSLASGPAVPAEALPGRLHTLTSITAMQPILDGIRAMLFFESRGAAGLTYAWTHVPRRSRGPGAGTDGDMAVRPQPHFGSAPGHRLSQITAWLDYAVELGASGLQLGPVFSSETHGYDTVDHFRIDPRPGDDDDFDKLIGAARERGLRVLLDGVFNHVGHNFPAPSRWLTGGDFDGHAALRELDHDEPKVLDHTVRVMSHWLDRRAAGWPLDAAYAVKPAFWKAAVDRVRLPHPQAWFVGEVIHGDYAAFLRDSGLDAVTQYELWKAVWSSLNDGNFFELSWALDRHAAVVEAGPPLTFVGNHDVTRIATRLTDPRHLGHALAVLCMVGGVPSIYYGDEQAFRRTKEDRAGGDDEIRPQFPAGPSELAPYGWPVFRLHQRLLGLRRRHSWLTHAVTRTNKAVVLTSTAADHYLILLLNVGDDTYRFPIATDGLVIAESSAQSDHLATVPAHGWSVLIPAASL